ncbi:uncharacterized protein LOC114753150 [Neltuma alba]|uniref:uncharacterized protein LOC114753150 n=1 Tax=Neltuma alba TaxID=207710 RepID=UPI0010A3B797|nr:uncharacterized protein LOC114753150 [Prosopis alba]
MGGCGSKSRVPKETGQHEHNTAPGEAVVGHNNEAISESGQSQPQVEARRPQLSLHEILDVDLDHQSNKRPSLSYLFHQSEDVKANNVKGETLDCEVKGSNEMDEGMKQESQAIEAKDKFSEETQSSNKAEKCEGNESEQEAEAKTSICKMK